MPPRFGGMSNSVTGHWGSAAVASGVEGMPVRAFRVTLPSGERYWTVVDHEYRVVGDVDVYLRHLRFGQDCAESTTKAYAESLALYLRWCERSERDWGTRAERLGAFVTWLKHTPSNPEGLCGLRITQWRKGDGLSTGHPGRCTLIFGAVGKQ